MPGRGQDRRMLENIPKPSYLNRLRDAALIPYWKRGLDRAANVVVVLQAAESAAGPPQRRCEDSWPDSLRPRVNRLQPLWANVGKELKHQGAGPGSGGPIVSGEGHEPCTNLVVQERIG